MINYLQAAIRELDNAKVECKNVEDRGTIQMCIVRLNLIIEKQNATK
jgi:hypothetical protein